MKLSYGNAKGFAKAIEAVANLVDEGVFKATEEGLSLMAMDPSQISMIVFKMPKNVFSEYDGEGETLGLDLDNFKKILKRGKSDEVITLETEENRLKVVFEGGKRRRSFKIPLLDITEGISREPAVEYNNNVKMLASTLKDIINDAKLISTHITFVLTPDGFEAIVKSESGEMNAKIEKDSEDIIEENVESGARATFPIQYLEDMLKAATSSEIVTLYVETDRPLKLEYNIEGALARYYLAPRIETE